MFTVAEFQQAVASIPLSTLRSSLKLHTRFRKGTSTEQTDTAVAVLHLLESIYPGATSWRDFVEDEEHVLEYMKSRTNEHGATAHVALPTTPPLPPPAIFADRTTSAVLSMFQTSAIKGLTSAAVNERMAFYGPNFIPPPPKPSRSKILWEQLTDFIVLILLAAAVISAGFGEFDVRQAV